MDKFDSPTPIKIDSAPANARFSIVGWLGRRCRTYALFEDYPSALEGLSSLRKKYPRTFFDILPLIEF